MKSFCVAALESHLKILFIQIDVFGWHLAKRWIILKHKANVAVKLKDKVTGKIN